MMPSGGSGTASPALASTKTPVPNVALTVPARCPPWPARAACWSQTMARSGIEPPQDGWESDPRLPVVGTSVGRVARGTPHVLTRSSSQSSAARPNSWVREAVDGSVRAVSRVEPLPAAAPEAGGEPRVDRPEGNPAVLRGARDGRDLLEQPPQLRGREIRVQRKT